MNGACQSAFKDGLGREHIRRLYNICNRIERSENGTIELEDAEFEFLEDTFSRAKFNPLMSKMVIQIYDKLDDTRLAEKEKEKEKK